jgi:hypothetical protein
MQQSGIVTEYLDALVRDLSFDIPLSRRVRQEVEDHLLETAADEPDGGSIESQRRAIARFGDPREIARQYAASSLLVQTRRVGMIVVLALAGIFIAMKGRGAWYGLMQWGLSDPFKRIGMIGLTIDLYAFRIALAVGLIGWGYIASCRSPAALHSGYRKQMRRCVLLCTITATALLTSVITDSILTGFRLSEAQFSASVLVPVLSMGAEIAFVTMLALRIRTTIQHAAHTASLFSD